MAIVWNSQEFGLHQRDLIKNLKNSVLAKVRFLKFSKIGYPHRCFHKPEAY